MRSTRNRSLAVVAGLLLATSTLVACSSDDSADGADAGDPVAATETTAKAGDAAVDDATDGDSPSWLFTQSASGGTLVPTGNGRYELTLTGVDPHSVAFTDRPDRKSAIVPVQLLVRAWPKLFADSAPNAVLVEHAPDGESDSSVVVLSDPRLDGDRLVFAAELQGHENADSSVGSMATASHDTPPASFGSVSLFIDDVNADNAQMKCVNGGGGLITPPGAVTIYYRPAAAFAATCEAMGGTVTVG